MKAIKKRFLITLIALSHVSCNFLSFNLFDVSSLNRVHDTTNTDYVEQGSLILLANESFVDLPEKAFRNCYNFIKAIKSGIGN